MTCDNADPDRALAQKTRAVRDARVFNLYRLMYAGVKGSIRSYMVLIAGHKVCNMEGGLARTQNR